MGALKRAWDRTNINKECVEFVFFGGRSNTLKDFVFRDGKLVAGNDKLKKSIEFTSGGISEVDFESYDVFVVYGLGFHVRDYSGFKNFSSSFLSDLAFEDFSNSLAFSLISSIRAGTIKRVYAGHVPLAAASPDGTADLRLGDYDFSFDFFRNALEKNKDVVLVKQPAETIFKNSYTKYCYSKGSKRMAVGASNDNAFHPETDVGHMNDQFGELWLKAFFDALHESSIK